MARLAEPRDLFVHELRDILYAERQLAKALPRLAREATDRELASGFAQHAEETRDQIQNLERVFSSLGMAARATRCPGIEGIQAEHDEFMSEKDAPADICDMFLTGAGARAEHYEIAAYDGLITMARALGEDEAAGLLEENLRQEQETLRRLQAISHRLAVGGAAGLPA